MPMMPPSLTGTPPMGASPVAAPSASPGTSAGALATVREAIDLLNKALPQLPANSEPWKAVSDAIRNIGKYVPASAQVPGVQKTELMNLMQNAGKNAMLNQVMGSMGGGPAGMGAGGAAPPPGAA